MKQFEIVHEKLFHLFIVSQDLQYFAHVHPQLATDGIFRLNTSLPQARKLPAAGGFLSHRRYAAVVAEDHHDGGLHDAAGVGAFRKLAADVAAQAWRRI